MKETPLLIAFALAAAFFLLPQSLNKNSVLGVKTTVCAPSDPRLLCTSVDNSIFNLAIPNCSKFEDQSELRTTSRLAGGTKLFNNYCYKPADFSKLASYHIISLFFFILMAMLIEIPILYILGYRTERFIIPAFYANVLSAVILYPLSLFNSSPSLLVVLLQMSAVAGEIVFIMKMCKSSFHKRVIISAFAANIATLTVGAFLLLIIRPFYI